MAVVAVVSSQLNAYLQHCREIVIRLQISLTDTCQLCGSHEPHMTSHLLQHPLRHREADQLIQLQHPTVPTQVYSALTDSLRNEKWCFPQR